MPAGRSCSAGAVRSAAVSRRRRLPYRSLRARADFERVRRTGSRRRAGPIRVLIASGAPGPPRVGFVAGKSVGGAVERNRAKRRLRAALARTPIREGHDYVVIATPAIAEASFEDLVAWLGEAVHEQEDG